MKSALEAAGMRGVVWSFCAAVLGGAVVAGFAVVFLPVGHRLVLDFYLLFVGGITLLALVRTTSVAQPGSGGSLFEQAIRPVAPSVARPPELVSLEQRLALAATTAFDVHYRLRPVVREIAGQQLWARHAVDLETDPKRAESLLGRELWELVRPDRPAPPEPFARGLGFPGIERLVAELESGRDS